MKKISKQNLSLLLGGWAYPKECAHVEYIANEVTNHPELAKEFDWDAWVEAFDTFCLGL